MSVSIALGASPSRSTTSIVLSPAPHRVMVRFFGTGRVPQADNLTIPQLLDIAGNQLTEIPSGLPESLQYLYLQNNKISAVPADAFQSTPNLKGVFLR